jgi:hypothetical protein
MHQFRTEALISEHDLMGSGYSTKGGSIMNRMPPGTGSCCLPAADGITYLRVGPKGDPVGIQRLASVFNQLLSMERSPEEASNEELIGMVRKFNYIPYNAAVEAEYAEALRKAYTSFCAQQAQDEQ